MRVLTLCKRRYTGKDLLLDRYGRLFHLPVQLAKLGNESMVIAADYQSRTRFEFETSSTKFLSIPLTVLKPWQYYAAIHRAAEEFRPDVVLASSDIHFGWLGRRLGKGLGVPFVFDLYDNYKAFASARLPGGRALLDSVIASADLIVVASLGLLDLFGQSSMVRVVTNGTDVEMFAPMDQGEQRVRLGLHGSSLIVGYVGALTRDRGIETLIEAVAQLHRGRVDVKLLMAGPIDGSFDMHQRWIDYRGNLDQSDIPALINACDVVVLPYPDTDWARYTSANKVQEYLACQVPMVVTDISSYRQVAAAQEAICRPSDSEDMARAVRFQLSNRRLPMKVDLSWRARAEELSAALSAVI